MDAVAGDAENSGLLDYVTGWYFKAADYIAGTRMVVGFVSTNSISQGEQVGVLWNYLFQHHRLKILFAHRTFPWVSEARGKAHVHVVIIGFAAFDSTNKRIYDYDGETPVVTTAPNISPYLAEGTDFAIVNRSLPLCDVPELAIGNKPIDNGIERWCLWVGDCGPVELRKCRKYCDALRPYEIIVWPAKVAQHANWPKRQHAFMLKTFHPRNIW